MTPSQLKYELSVKRPESKYFSKENMRFSGDTMANYRVRSVVRNGRSCWELYRKTPVGYGLQSSTYFDKETFNTVY